MADLDDGSVGDDLRAAPEPPRVLVAFRAHWSLFLPALVIAVLYLGGWTIARATGPDGGAIARLLLLVGTVAPPLLLAHAFFRWRTIRLAVLDTGEVIVRRSASDRTHRLRAADIADLDIRRGLVGRLFDVGTIAIRQTTGKRLVLRDIAAPDAVKQAVLNANAARA